jgi:hypothetical protein
MAGDEDVGVNPLAAIADGGQVQNAAEQFGSRMIGLFQGTVNTATQAAVVPQVQAGYHGFLDQGLTALQSIQRHGVDLGQRVQSGGAMAGQTDGANAGGFDEAGTGLADQTRGTD